MNSYVYLKFNDIDINKLTNKFKKLNIDILDIKKNYIVKIYYNDLIKIEKNLFYLDYNIIKYSGLINIKKILSKYKYILIFLLLSFIVIYFLSNLIVDIDINHENINIINVLNEELEKNGIKKFSFAKKYEDINKIKKKIKNNHLDLIDWLEIKKVGMKYVIDVEMRIINEEKIVNNYCNVVAKKDGLITSIKVLAGEQIVQINDYVKKGDILISGDITLNQNVVNHVCADAKIYADSWYLVNVNIPLYYYKTKKTGKKRNNIIINFNDNEYVLFKNRLDNFESSKKLILDFLGIKFYLRKDYQVRKEKYKYNYDDIDKIGISMAKEKLKLKLNKDEEIKIEKVLQKSVNDSTISLDIFIVAEEQISSIDIIKEE